MRQVMGCPSRQQLGQRDDSESRMASTPLKVLWSKAPGPKFDEVFRPQASKFIQQLTERPTLNLSCVPLAIKGLETFGFPKLHHHPRPRNPVGAFGVNQMTDDIERAPSVFTFVLQRPHVREITQKHVESGGGASEQRDCVVQRIFHRASQFIDDGFKRINCTVLVHTGEQPKSRAALTL